MTQKNDVTPDQSADDKTTDRAPSEQGTGHGDGLLDSLGKAIVAPIAGAAEPDETARDKPPATRGD